MTTWQALFIGLLQGATELFPVSSLGHAVVLPALLHWSYRQSDPAFVPFLTLLHLGTAGALLILYRQDWARIAAGFVRAALRGRVKAPEERLGMLLVVGLALVFQSVPRWSSEPSVCPTRSSGSCSTL